MRLKLRKCFGSTVLGSALVVGCQNAPPRQVSYNTAPAMGTAMVTGPSYYMASPPVVTTAPAAPVVLPQATVEVPHERMPDTLPAATTVATTKDVVQATTPVAPAPEVAKKDTVQASYSVANTRMKPETVKRRTFNDITANPAYDHAKDYTWLVGELQYVHVRNTWRLRYASVDEEDKYGGSVTLTEMGPMNSFKTGQLVRVEGQVANPDSHNPAPEFRVQSIRPAKGE